MYLTQYMAGTFGFDAAGFVVAGSSVSSSASSPSHLLSEIASAAWGRTGRTGSTSKSSSSAHSQFINFRLENKIRRTTEKRRHVEQEQRRKLETASHNGVRKDDSANDLGSVCRAKLA